MEWVAAVGLDDGLGWDDVLAFAAGAVTVLTMFALIGRSSWWREIKDLFAWLRKFRLDWDGEPARDGRDMVPGVMARMNAIDGEFRRNGGATMKDALYRTERTVKRIDRRLDATDAYRDQIIQVATQNLDIVRGALTAQGVDLPPAVPFPPLPVVISEPPEEGSPDARNR